MPRIVKPPLVRRDEILDSARRLVFTKGYERMAIQDIVDELQIAKGTVYHYFASKQALLEALLDRQLDEAEQLLRPIVADPDLPALTKLQRVFDAIGQWKTGQQRFHLALLRVWYADENAIVRWKLDTRRVQRLGPLLTVILQRGIAEGTLAVEHPLQTSAVLLGLLQDLVDALARVFLAATPGGDNLRALLDTVAAYTAALERVLGTPSGTLTLVDQPTLAAWLDAFRHDDAR